MEVGLAPLENNTLGLAGIPQDTVVVGCNVARSSPSFYTAQECKDARLSPVAYNILVVAGTPEHIGVVPCSAGQECKDALLPPVAYNTLGVAGTP